MPPRKTPQKKAAENGTNGKKAAPVVNTVRPFLISNSVPAYFDSSLVSHSRSWSYFGETLKYLRTVLRSWALFLLEPV